MIISLPSYDGHHIQIVIHKDHHIMARISENVNHTHLSSWVPVLIIHHNNTRFHFQCQFIGYKLIAVWKILVEKTCRKARSHLKIQFCG